MMISIFLELRSVFLPNFRWYRWEWSRWGLFVKTKRSDSNVNVLSEPHYQSQGHARLTWCRLKNDPTHKITSPNHKVDEIMSKFNLYDSKFVCSVWFGQGCRKLSPCYHHFIFIKMSQYLNCTIMTMYRFTFINIEIIDALELIMINIVGRIDVKGTSKYLYWFGWLKRNYVLAKLLP